MRIDVTQDDIDAGIRIDCTHCPIALAVRRLIPYANVGCYTVYADEMPDYVLPQPAIDFIRAFDNKRPVKPFSFDMERKSR